ncbi:MAG: glycosyltransferase family 2 protein [Phycisphaerales bacterium]|nr:glycosyltransferase family 2 protein [Phycisphaerales bacterium]
MSTKISIIVPVFNSCSFLPKLLYAIDEQRINNNWNLELVLVDDGSKDNSFEQIILLQKQYSYIKGIKLSRNFGHQVAVRTGLQYATGEYIAIIDDDLQDPPSILPGFFDYLNNGYDVAYGVRRKRKERFFKKVAYNAFYRILQKLSNIEIPLDTGDFCVMKKVVIEKMLLLNEKNPFLRGIRAWVGFKQIGVQYERQARAEGESGYTISKLLKIAFDGIFSFSKIPIRFITYLGLIGLLIATIYSVFVITLKLMGQLPEKGYATIILLISFFGSLTLICLGIIGEYIVRIYDETQNRPHSIIAETINI